MATVVDDLFGFLRYTVGELAVTRRLDLDYLAPVLLDTPLPARRCTVARRPEVASRGQGEDAEARAVATATALFIVGFRTGEIAYSTVACCRRGRGTTEVVTYRLQATAAP